MWTKHIATFNAKHGPKWGWSDVPINMDGLIWIVEHNQRESPCCAQQSKSRFQYNQFTKYRLKFKQYGYLSHTVCLFCHRTTIGQWVYPKYVATENDQNLQSPCDYSCIQSRLDSSVVLLDPISNMWFPVISSLLGLKCLLLLL